ncbi:hypothetical protein [Ruegeria conchae]|uniref:Uncharacterized protein n=1 Tax=Ruegeria conchae TaxID=981384 RepID=A0A497ZMC4_9RHOB|nr:hypothetical protein [Ruegeria conchae]RLK08213.1 hypothetical protein CLV75_1883 [Ruegeria conchae]
MKDKEKTAFGAKTKGGATNFILTNHKVLKDSFHLVAFGDDEKVSVPGKKITRGKIVTKGKTVTLCAEDPNKIKGKVLDKLNKQLSGICTLKVANIDMAASLSDDQDAASVVPPVRQPTQKLPSAGALGTSTADYGNAILADDEDNDDDRQKLVRLVMGKLAPLVRDLGPKGRAQAEPELDEVAKAIDKENFDADIAKRLIKSLTAKLANGTFSKLDPPARKKPTQPLPSASAAAGADGVDYNTSSGSVGGGSDGVDYNTSSGSVGGGSDGVDYNTSSGSVEDGSDGVDYNTSSGSVGGGSDGVDYNTSSGGQGADQMRLRLRSLVFKKLAPEIRGLGPKGKAAAAAELEAAVKFLDLKSYDEQAARRLLSVIKNKLETGIYEAMED